MNKYVNELLKLKNDIELKTNEALQNSKKTKFELLDKAVEKIYAHYDELLDSIQGINLSFTLKLGEKSYDFVFYSNKDLYKNEPSRFAYIRKVSSFSEDCYIINKNAYGFCTYSTRGYYEVGHGYSYFLKHPLPDGKRTQYHQEYIEVLIKYNDAIEQEFIKTVENIVKENNFKNAKKISERAELINTLENFINS